MIVRLADINRKARYKPSGYREDWLAAGRLTGIYLDIPSAEYKRLKAKYAGVGDKLHDFLAPYVRRWDAIFGTHLAGCGGCMRRAEKLNRAERWLRRVARRLRSAQ